MRTYSLTLKDKLYLFFHEDYDKRFLYLLPKVREHQIKWFRNNNLRVPREFDRYINNYIGCLLNDYELRK